MCVCVCVCVPGPAAKQTSTTEDFFFVSVCQHVEIFSVFSTYSFKYILLSMFIYISQFISIAVYRYRYVYTCICIFTCIHTHTHIHICIKIYTDVYTAIKSIFLLVICACSFKSDTSRASRAFTRASRAFTRACECLHIHICKCIHIHIACKCIHLHILVQEAHHRHTNSQTCFRVCVCVHAYVCVTTIRPLWRSQLNPSYSKP